MLLIVYITSRMHKTNLLEGKTINKTFWVSFSDI